eukprot:11518328-Ditylum_brightwellii.AAC.1
MADKVVDLQLLCEYMLKYNTDYIGWIIESGQDDMGWWVYVKFAARNNVIVTIITAYQPCKVSKKNGTMAYHQQVAMLQQAE